jgi:hypothetical protein
LRRGFLDTCPRCGEEVSDTEGNYSITVWGGPEPVLVCPKGLFVLKGYTHHEDPNGPTISIKCDSTALQLSFIFPEYAQSPFISRVLSSISTTPLFPHTAHITLCLNFSPLGQPDGWIGFFV